jgi:hypothetical protein
LPRFELVENKFVDEAVVEKIFVVVALVAKKEAIVPRLVRDDAVTPAAKVLPVSEPAGAEPLIEPEIVLVTKRCEDVARPRFEFVENRFVEEAVLLNIFVVVALVARREAIVPRDVNEDAVMPAAKVLPVRFAAATEPADPLIEPEIGLVTKR